MSQNRKYIIWAVRIIISFLFILSAVAKMFPLWSFEKQLVDLGIATWCQSHYLARLIIALELAIGIAILMNHYLKRIVIPATILLLVAFCAHLTIEMVKHGAMNGNCGCFGQLIPMTPLEAFIKNIVTIGLLVYLWFQVKHYETSKFIYPLSTYLASGFAMFLLFPFAPCKKEAVSDLNPAIENVDTINQFIIDTSLSSMSEMNTISSSNVASQTISDSQLNSKRTTPNDGKVANVKESSTINSSATTNSKAQTKATSTVKSVQETHSKFYKFNKFGNTEVNLDQGKKIVCMFAAGCDHCQETAKELNSMIKAGQCPPDLFILFMDEEVDLIPNFFKIAGANFPYQVLDIPTFWNTIGDNSTTPGVFYLNNGKIIKSYNGIEAQKFNGEEFKKIVAQ